MKKNSIRPLLKLLFFFCFFVQINPLGAQWSQTKGPSGLHFFDQLSHHNRIWGASIGGLFYSDDEGESWNRHPAISYDDYVYSIRQLQGKLYIVVERGKNTAPGPLYTLLSSSDDGQNWTLVAGLPSPGGWPQVFPHNTGFLLVGGPNPHFSPDQGIHWQPISFPMSNGNTPSYDFDSKTIVAWYYQKGIFATQDMGQNWTVAADSASGFTKVEGVRENEIIATKQVPAPVYAEHYYTQNLGQSWTLLSDPFPNSTFSTSFRFWGTDTLLASNPTFNGQYKISLDGGIAWQDWTQWGTDGFLPNIVTNDGALNGTTKYYFATGNTEIRNEGLKNETIRDIQSNASSLFVNTNNGIFSSQDAGETWEHLPFDIWIDRGQLGVAGDNLYACGANTLLFSTNGGLSNWDTLSHLALNGLFELRIFGDKIVLETNQGTTILNRHTGQVQALNSPINHGQIYILGNRYVLADYDHANVWVSVNEGQTWTQTLSGNDPGGRMLHAGGRLMICTRTTTFLSEDEGASWMDIGSIGLPINPLGWGGNALPGEAVAVDGIVYASFPDYGVYQTVDLGAHWTPFNDNLGAFRTNGLSVHKGQLFLGTATSSVWRNPLAESPTIAPSALENLPLAPNPTTGQFTLQLPFPDAATLCCYDAQGKLIWQKRVPGGATLLDMGNSPGGVYRLVAIAAGKTYSASLLLQK